MRSAMPFSVSVSRSKALLLASGARRSEMPFTEGSCRFAQRFEVAPNRADPEPHGDRQKQPDQTPGQQADAQFERHGTRPLVIGIR